MINTRVNRRNLCFSSHDPFAARFSPTNEMTDYNQPLNLSISPLCTTAKAHKGRVCARAIEIKDRRYWNDPRSHAFHVSRIYIRGYDSIRGENEIITLCKWTAGDTRCHCAGRLRHGPRLPPFLDPGPWRKPESSNHRGLYLSRPLPRSCAWNHEPLTLGLIWIQAKEPRRGRIFLVSFHLLILWTTHPEHLILNTSS